MNTETAIFAVIAQGHVKPTSEYPLVISKLIMNDLKRLMGDNVSIHDVSKERWHIQGLLWQLAYLLSHEIIESHHVKTILNDAWDMEPYAWDIGWYLSDTKILEGTDSSELDAIILELLGKNEKIVNDIKKGKTKAAGSLIGPIMAKTSGKANPKELMAKIIEMVNQNA
tara:strand:- start:1533 stop:2039 length:507 start_codon:yes stop_codon:yes gene_type:complete